MVKAIDALTSRGVDQFILLGDVFETGKEIRQTVGILRQLKTAGVFGNHDLGLAIEPDQESLEKYGQEVIDFFATLKANYRHGDFLFSHVNPAWDATDMMVYYYCPMPWEDPEFGKSFEVHP
ncbi:MAG: metallophosphoesterase, partial [Pirellula sp.]